MKIHLFAVAPAAALVFALTACGGGSTASSTPSASAPAAATADSERGAKLYAQRCASCHQADGKGLPGAFPPVAESDYFKADSKKVATAILKGVTGKVTVNGKDYNSAMPPVADLKDDEVADVVNYVVMSFGNKGATITADEVKALR